MWKKKVLCGDDPTVGFFSFLSKTHSKNQVLILRGNNFVLSNLK